MRNAKTEQKDMMTKTASGSTGSHLRRARRALLPLVCGLACLGPATAADELVAVQVGRVITLAGDDIQRGTILVRDGRIEAIGKDVEVPLDATVVRFPEGVAMPGMIDCHSQAGLRVPNESMANVPFITVLDGVDPSAASLLSSVRDGITVVHVIPGNVTQIGGQGAVLRTVGRTVEDLLIKSPSGLKVSFEPPRGSSRMENVAGLRRTFLDLHRYVLELARAEEKPSPLEGKPAEKATLESLYRARPAWETVAWEKVAADKIDPRRQPLVDLVRGELRAFLHCPSATDVFRAFELMDQNGLKATLVLGADAYKLTGILKGREGLGPVILDPELVVWETDPDTGAERRHVTPRILHDAGIRFALQRDANVRFSPFSAEGEEHLWYQAAQLVRFGIPRDEALAAITRLPAEILGLEHRMGTLEPGKDGNITILSGDPLDARSWVEVVLIEGKVSYERRKDADLELLLKDPERAF